MKSWNVAFRPAAILLLLVAGFLPVAAPATAPAAPTSALPEDDFWWGDPVNSWLDGDVEAIGQIGNDIVVAGHYLQAGAGGPRCVLRWNGESWQAMSAGLGSSIPNDFFTREDGLWAAAENRLYHWNGSTWEASPSAPADCTITAEHDGLFYAQSGTRIFRLVDSVWRPVGPAQTAIRLLAFLDRQPVTVLQPPRSAGQVMVLEGETWTPLGGPAPDVVSALGDHDGHLYAALGKSGRSGWSDASRISEWSAASGRWTNVGGSLNGLVTGFVEVNGRWMVRVIDDSGCPGCFDGYNYAPTDFRAWDGCVWTPASDPVFGIVEKSIVLNGSLHVCGYFDFAGTTAAPRLARLDDGKWSPVTGSAQKTGDCEAAVRAIATFNGQVVVGGSFMSLGGRLAPWLAAGNGTGWQPLGEGPDDAVFALAEYQGELIAGGDFENAGGAPAAHVAAWNGTTWRPLGAGLDERVISLHVYQGRLYAGGWFRGSGSRPCPFLARWDGADWSAVAGGIDGAVMTMAEYGGSLVAGGLFHSAGGAPAPRVAAFDGSSWRGLPGISGVPLSLVTWDSLLVVGGMIRELPGRRLSGLAAWNGAEWKPVCDGLAGPGYVSWVNALAVSRGALVAGGAFRLNEQFAGEGIARWDGTRWQPLGSGVDGIVLALADVNGSLFVGGQFNSAGHQLLPNLARWDDRVVPATLSEMQFLRDGEAVDLHWKAAGPTNHTSYEVFREEPAEEGGQSTRVRLGPASMAGADAYAFRDQAPPVGGARYWLREVGPNSTEAWQGPFDLASLPPGIRLGAPAPNPFSAGTTFRYTLQSPVRAKLSVHDLQGRLVRVLFDGERPAGEFSAEWDGRNDAGGAVASGAYWFRLAAGNSAVTRRVIRLR